MSTDANLSTTHGSGLAIVPDLQSGDRLSAEEFHRRYESMPHVKHAELVEGVVYMASPVSKDSHAVPHAVLTTWLGTYSFSTPGTEIADNATVRLDNLNEVQPDTLLRVLTEHGGRTRMSGKYLAGPPEFVAEVAASSVSYDLHDKKEAYRKNGVQEYLVWRVDDQAVDWFALDDGEYRPLPTEEDGVTRSRVFPGLWLATGKLLAGQRSEVLATLHKGLESDAHQAFVEQLGSKS